MAKEELHPVWVIANTARSIYRSYRSYVEFEDLISLGRLWELEHVERMREYQEMEEPRLAAWRMGKDLWQVMDRYARKERADALGYKPKDEFCYTEIMITEMLPRVFAGIDTPDRIHREEITAIRDPAENGDYLAAYVDIEQSILGAGLSEVELSILWGMYLDGMTQEAVGADLSLSQSTVALWHTKAIRKLQKALGGPPSKGCPYDCECHEGKLRKRPGIKSNDSGRNQLLG